jgi:hypothetical protein
MKTLLHSLLLSLALIGAASAQTKLPGTWQGRLEVAPGKTLAIHFVLTEKAGGGYTAVVTSPDEGAIKNVPAKSVDFTADKLKIDVPSLSGGYVGTLRNGVFEGEWTQEGSKLPLSLKPYKTPTMTKAGLDTLRGEWFGKITGPGGTVTIVLRFADDAKGVLKPSFDVPEQGVKDWEAANVVLDEGNFAIDLPKPQAKVKGILKGDQIVGEWTQLGLATPITLKKGKYVPVVGHFDIPAATYGQVKGRWTGSLNGLAVAVRFEVDAQGRQIGFFDSLQQNLLNIPITEAAVTGTKLTFTLGFGGKFTGELAAGKMTGEWNQPGLPKPLPLELTRDK